MPAMVRQGIPSDPQLTRRMLLSLGLVLACYPGAIGLALWMGVAWWGILAFVVAAVAAQYFVGTHTVGSGLTKHDLGADREPQLHGTAERLCALAGIAKPRIRVIEVDAPNAFAYGRGGRATSLCVTRGLLDRLETAEVEAVVAHELSHVANRDALVMSIASFLGLASAYLALTLDAAGTWSEARLRAYDRRHGVGLVGGDGPADEPAAPGRGGKVVATIVLIPTTAVFYLGFGAFMIVFALVTALVTLVGLLFSLPLSRTREYAADRAAAYLTGRPSALSSALLKVGAEHAGIPRADARALRHAAAFCVVPMTEGSGATVRATGGGLLSSHPSIEDRIDRLAVVARELGGTAPSAHEPPRPGGSAAPL